ncbi:MAG: 50S ribosomal protein L23 [Gemmatimonadetes bacterium]|uniref:Large ribosomal subunit protein uL23 n=1 Tax=Candidatus Kutchimonas denitrificans TaxID=3056748 RepID=A0AAE4Z4Y1_9BACT|nr:50S ribosomal protein L23 [Gemmatimonadota bacterium]NIR73850.1 50S ribosomal protein L23 [Candidatus Kutchimonas denitrificans]NIR99656.1 50S ribosomal protein L23 [Gemmatimonadota bacterium]NIT65241.1 50S ribosomal protein L23 [Gemmatimonadota bacterium]NIW73690.1 50S ribosomal protein L23 [Gemmatimonadota bacterium]
MRDPREVIVRPIITEKSTAGQAEENRYTFEVLRDAGKVEIKQAVEALFNVHVLKVRTSRQRGKWRRRGVHVGKRPNWKKAMVQLAEGETIEVFEGL